MKSVLGDYGMLHTAALQWGYDHESDAIQQYILLSGLQVKDCRVFLSEQFPYLAIRRRRRRLLWEVETLVW